MTAYASWFHDFPNRCWRVFENALVKEEFEGYDVTLLLMTLMATIIIPHERLFVEPNKRKYVNPSGDVNNHPHASNEYNRLLDQNFRHLLRRLDCEIYAWKYGGIENMNNGFDDWISANYELVTQTHVGKSFTVREFIHHMRDALSHGNIFVSPSNGEIERIIFLKGKPKGENRYEDSLSANDFNFYYLVSTPQQLSMFLRGWIYLLPEPKEEVIITVENHVT